MIKQCEFCGKDFEVTDTVHGRQKRFCNTSCSAKWRINTYGKVQVSEQGRKNQAKSLSNLWKTKEFRDNNHKRMTENNPVYQDGVIKKSHETRLKNGGYSNNFKYGNGKISEYEEKVYDLLLTNGFYYNYAIPTKIAKDTFIDKHYPPSYKPDFTNLVKKICIEIDGNNHTTKHQIELDKKKDECLQFLGFTVIRFTHAQIDNGELERWIEEWQN